MHQRIGVDDEDDKRRQSKKGEERQFDIEEGQFDGAFQQKIFMGDGARRDRDVEENEEIGEPEPAADGGGVLDRFFDLLEIVGLFGDGGQIRRAAGGAVWRSARRAARASRHARNLGCFIIPPRNSAI